MRTDPLAPHCAYPHAARTLIRMVECTPCGPFPADEERAAVRRADGACRRATGRRLNAELVRVDTVRLDGHFPAPTPARLDPSRADHLSARHCDDAHRLFAGGTLAGERRRRRRAVGAALIHRPVECTLHWAPTVNDPRLVCSIRPCRCLALSRWFCGFEWRCGTQCGQPVSRPLGQRLLPRTRRDSHVRRCEAHSRYCSRWCVDFQMAVLLALDRNGFGLWRERYRACAISGSRRGFLPQGPIPSAF